MDMLDVSKLSGLLEESREAQERSHNGSATTTTMPNKALSTTQVSTGKNSQVQTGKSASSDAIWGDEEIPSEDTVGGYDPDDKRLAPRYEFSYKQAVGTQDTFLGLHDLTPASSDCSHIVVKIHFPGSKLKDLDVDVTPNRIKASSKTHKLFTYLPVTVDKDKGEAKFDSSKEVLTLTLPIVREF